MTSAATVWPACVVQVTLWAMDEHLQEETERLTRSWMQHDKVMLREYLVSGVEDPRINVQSILTRHFLIVSLFERAFESLLEHELRFALVMNWLLSILGEIAGAEDCHAILHALERGADNAEGIAIPNFVSKSFQVLPQEISGVALSNYTRELLHRLSQTTIPPALDEEVLNSFQRAWTQALRNQAPAGRTVLEPACGSANDYRFVNGYGLARLIEYTGFDLCPTNIANAQALFPGAHFEAGNVFDLRWPNHAFDYGIVHDLFEHLSLAGLDRALSELCRVTRRALCLGFFNLHEGEDHIVRPTDEYHWNTLSVPRLRELLERQGFLVEIIHIDTFLKWRFGCELTHNKNAYTFLATRRYSRESE